MKRAREGIDFISRLPENIIHMILSKLPIKDAARTSVLSQTWNLIWGSFPIFKFNQELFGEELLDTEIQGAEIQEKRESFLKFVENTLQRLWIQRISISRFSLKMTLCDIEWSHRIEKWIELVTREENVLKLMQIHIQCPGIDPIYWPLLISLPESLAVLRLMGCKFVLDATLPDNISRFNSLDTVSLLRVHTDTQTIKNLFHCCPGITSFELMISWGNQILRIPHHPKLHKLKVCQNQQAVIKKIEIDAPNLEIFYYDGGNAACEIEVNSCKKIKELFIANAGIQQEFLEDFIIDLEFLNTLHLRGCDELHRILICGFELRSLVLDGLRNLLEANIYAPKLESFKFHRLNFMSSTFWFFTSKLPEAKLSLTFNGPVNTLTFLRLRKYLGNFHESQKLTIRLLSPTSVVFDEETMRERSIRPQKLRYVTIRMCSSLNYEALVDGCFGLPVQKLWWLFLKHTVLIL